MNVFGDLSEGSGANFLNHTLKPGFAVLFGATVLSLTANSGPSEIEINTEACVSALVDRPVNLVPDLKNGGLFHPASVMLEQRACEESNNNVDVAAHSMGILAINVSDISGE